MLVGVASTIVVALVVGLLAAGSARGRVERATRSLRRARPDVRWMDRSDALALPAHGALRAGEIVASAQLPGGSPAGLEAYVTAWSPERLLGPVYGWRHRGAELRVLVAGAPSSQVDVLAASAGLTMRGGSTLFDRGPTDPTVVAACRRVLAVVPEWLVHLDGEHACVGPTVPERHDHDALALIAALGELDVVLESRRTTNGR